MTSGRGVLALMAACLLVGCAGLPFGPGKTHVVRKSDTLYSIAFRYGLDYRSLAMVNGIEPPYTIYPDQVLRLRGVRSPPEQDSGPAALGWRWPLDGRVVGSFSLQQPINKGIDIAGKPGAPVVASADGVVVYAGGNLQGYGKLVIIRHDDDYLSAYGNNAELLVSENEPVRAGEKIARVGITSNDIGLLRFEVRRSGRPRDPLGYLPAR